MTKGQTISLYRNLNQLGQLGGVKFSYAVARNINLLKTEIETIESTMKASPEFMAFENERIALLEKHAEKDEKGKLKKEIAENGSQQYVVGVNEKKFQKEFDVLKVKHKDAITAREKQADDYTKLLITESDFKPYMVKLAELPKEINARQTAGIYEIIEE